MSASEPIAIVGLGGILPGAATLDEFWNVVEAGIDTASEPSHGSLASSTWNRHTIPNGLEPTTSTPGGPVS